jgi:hypothetical protein
VKDSSGQKLGYFYYEEEPGVMAFIIGPAMAICVWLWICVAYLHHSEDQRSHRRLLPAVAPTINQGGQSMGWYLTLLGSA